MKDLRPPTLQTYTDKHTRQQAHIYTKGTSYSCTHIDTEQRHKHAYTHTPHARKICESRLCNFKTVGKRN